MRTLLLLLLAFSANAVAECPKSKKEWQAKGPKILVEKARLQHIPVEIPDFTAKLAKAGKNGKRAHEKGAATGNAFPIKNNKLGRVMVQAHDEESAVFLSGILQCDPEKKEPVLVSLTYVKGEQSGIVKVIAP